jgi:hypothetical protein
MPQRMRDAACELLIRLPLFLVRGIGYGRALS